MPSTPADFRRLALSFPKTEERKHMNHPDFRVGGRIFATLGYPAHGWAMIKLPLEEQEFFVRAAPDAFVVVKGAWGRQGATNVILAAAKQAAVRAALEAAWRCAASHPPKGKAKRKGRVAQRR